MASKFIVWKCSHSTETNTNTDSYWVLLPFDRTWSLSISVSVTVRLSTPLHVNTSVHRIDLYCKEFHRRAYFFPLQTSCFTCNGSAHVSQANDSVQLSYYIRNGGDPNMTFHRRDMIKTRFTILHMCCQKGHYECAKYLIEHGKMQARAGFRISRG